MTARTVRFNRSGVSEGARVVKSGGLIIYPTDTVYGLGCDPFDERAVSRLFQTKGREAKPVPVLCADLESAGRLVSMNDTALSLARRHWPGQLTIVAPLKRRVPVLVDQGGGTVGVRVPALPLCVELIRLCGGFLTGTSANVSGFPSCRSAEESLAALGEKVDLVLDGGTRDGQESTVVRIDGDSFEVLRRGTAVVW